MRDGLTLADRLGCLLVTFESDCFEIIIQACNGESEIWSTYSAVLAECFQFAFRIDSVSFAHCPREANKVSHCLARNSYDSDSVVFRDGDPPSFLLAELVHDVTVF